MAILEKGKDDRLAVLLLCFKQESWEVSVVADAETRFQASCPLKTGFANAETQFPKKSPMNRSVYDHSTGYEQELTLTI